MPVTRAVVGVATTLVLSVVGTVAWLDAAGTVDQPQQVERETPPEPTDGNRYVRV
ncbi:hypothetical protein [Nocardioides coralli]|uniref:hypothetical protein n=1 Tax=Nocardioides coralli TaxID=2872154 RepID=UPI001CA40AA1|nr:hypothetical protein [Nocardioides coralli]QZY27856.1 hypothetical protein K6T13_10080 [Nocardioides coralli]